MGEEGDDNSASGFCKESLDLTTYQTNLSTAPHRIQIQTNNASYTPYMARLVLVP